MSRVALVFPYFRTRAATEMLFPPLGAATLAAQLRRRDIETRVFDGTFGTFEQLSIDLIDYRPDIVGVYSMVSLTATTLRVAETVRTSLPQALLVAGGPLPTVFPGRYTQHFDAVFRGEADVSFPSLLPGLPRGRGHAAADGRAAARHLRRPLRPRPRPARGQRDRPPRGERTGDVPSARQERLRPRGVSEGVAAEDRFQGHLDHRHAGLPLRLRLLLEADLRQRRAAARPRRGVRGDRRRSARSATTACGSPTTRSPWTSPTSRSSAGASRARGISWSCLSRANGIAAETVRLMKEAGCRRVYLGLESGSQATLDLMNKQVTRGAGRSRRGAVSRGRHRGGRVLHRRATRARRSPPSRRPSRWR